MGRIHNHNEAIATLCCASTVSILSYEEAVGSYLKLRGVTLAKVDALSERVRKGPPFLPENVRVMTLTELADRTTDAARIAQLEADNARLREVLCLADRLVKEVPIAISKALTKHSETPNV